MRLYQKHEMALRQPEVKDLDEQIVKQVEYARDNINALQKLVLEEPTPKGT